MIRYTLVEYMPRHLRNSHTQAGNRGSYPANGAERVYIEHEVLSRDLDPRWVEILEDGIRREDIPEDALTGVLADYPDCYLPIDDLDPPSDRSEAW
jgi:hypothetical protein